MLFLNDENMKKRVFDYSKNIEQNIVSVKVSQFSQNIILKICYFFNKAIISN